MSQASPAVPGPQPQSSQPPGSGLAIASMVLGILSLPLFCFWPGAIPLGILATVLGFVARSKVKAGTGAGGGMAMAGIVCGIIAIVLAILMLAGVAAFLGFGGAKVVEDMQKEIQKQQQQQQNAPGPQGMLVEPLMTYARAWFA